MIGPYLLLAKLDLSPLPDVKGDTNAPIAAALKIFFGITGATAVLVITIAALRLVLARGNPEGLNRARNTIIYAAIGLLVALAAYSLVTFVVGRT